mmetsp:Transcript_15331/g.42246  ORF Transcript_15331/g.42246 Transcript_15331/m.42246 type:complete len:215 (-) Transcript_15331:231-875(-)
MRSGGGHHVRGPRHGPQKVRLLLCRLFGEHRALLRRHPDHALGLARARSAARGGRRHGAARCVGLRHRGRPEAHGGRAAGRLEDRLPSRPHRRRRHRRSDGRNAHEPRLRRRQHLLDGHPEGRCQAEVILVWVRGGLRRWCRQAAERVGRSGRHRREAAAGGVGQLRPRGRQCHPGDQGPAQRPRGGRGGPAAALGRPLRPDLGAHAGLHPEQA